MPIWQETPGKSNDTLEKYYISSLVFEYLGVPPGKFVDVGIEHQQKTNEQSIHMLILKTEKFPLRIITYVTYGNISLTNNELLLSYISALKQ